jgi:cytochrome c oxidase subunit 2
VIGHLFWWEVRYPEGVVTANEIHLPVGRTVVFRLTAADVIHSFWVPSLQGKRDLIPGQVNTLRVMADEAGRFRGQCAEFCGEGHALMALWVVAHEPAGFERWIERARTAAASEPGAELQPPARRGRDIFFAAGCGACHSTRGAPVAAAAGQPGPDLSDLAARSTLAAGTVPNTPAFLRRWIRDPQAIKPGALMPPTPLPDGDMDALVAYLETLR